MMLNRKLGSMGEAAFSMLCGDAGLTANPSIRDETGWDYFVEFPYPEELPDHLDLTPAPINCLIQVKATDKSDRDSIAISLSNLLRLVHFPGPAFFCLLEFKDNPFPESVYLVHVGDIIIKKVLKKLRKLSQENHIRLHKKTMIIKFDNSHILKHISGGNLRETIECHIPYGIRNYRKNKQYILDKIGFEKGNAILHFTVRGKDIRERLVDLSLGIKQLRVEQSSLFHMRFNIPDTLPSLDLGPGYIEAVPEPIGGAKITITQRKFGPGLTFDADWYTTSVNQLLPLNSQKFRLSNKLFDMVFTNFSSKENDENKVKNVTGTIQFSILNNYNGEKLELVKFMQLVQLLEMQKYSTGTLNISVNLTFFQKYYYPEDKPVLLNGQLSIDSPIIEYEKLICILNQSYAIAKLFNIENNIELSLNQLLQYSESIRIFHDSVVDKSRRFYKIEFKDGIQGYEGPESLGGKRVAGVVCVTTKIGDYCFACIFAILSDTLRWGKLGHLELLSYETGYHHLVIFEEKDKPTNDETEAQFENVMSKIRENGIEPIRVMPY